MTAQRPTTGRPARRGVSLVEMQVAILILAVISIPALAMGIGLVREAALNRTETTLQWDLDHALWRATRPVREAHALSGLTANKLQMTNVDGGSCQVYLYGSKLFERLGTHAAIPIAEDVSAFQVTYYRTKSGKRTVTTDPAAVTELKVDLTLSRGGYSRTGSLLVTVRNRPR